MENEEEIIVSIDFGSSRTGYAYYSTKKKKIRNCRFPLTGEKLKTLNEIIINDSDEVVKYGFETKKYLSNMMPNEYFYKNIKMNLYENKDKILPVIGKKEIYIEKLILIILKYIKAHVLETLGIKEVDYQEKRKKIKWVLTVPAIWDEKNKNIMINAAENAGIVENIDKSFFLALEPEAASYYCLKEYEDREEDKENKENKGIFNGPYIVCDLGGGTVDIVCHERIIEDGEEKIIEKCKPKGGPYGSDQINKEFKEKILSCLFGKNTLNQLKDKFYNLDSEEDIFYYRFINLENEINLFKEDLNENELKKNFRMDCSIFFMNNKDLDKAKIIENYNKKCKKEWMILKEEKKDIYNGTISFPNRIMYDLIKNLTDKISKLIIEILDEVKNVSTILYVGGFCNSHIVCELIKENIKQKYPKINHEKPYNPDIAILHGAIYYCLDPERIKIRKAKYTLGICAGLNWEDKYNGIGKKREENGRTLCLNAFKCYVEKNQDIKFGEKITDCFSLTDYGDGFFGSKIIVYRSYKEKVLVVDEEGVDEIGRFDFTVKGDYKEEKDLTFLIIFELGGTFLNAIAFHRKSNTRVNMKFNYQ